MRRPTAQTRSPAADLADALDALTVDDLDDDDVIRLGILRAVHDLVRRTVDACGGHPRGDVAVLHESIAAAAAAARRLAREADAVFEDVTPIDPDDVPPF